MVADLTGLEKTAVSKVDLDDYVAGGSVSR